MSENLEQWLREEPLRSDPRPWIAALVECLQRMDVEISGDRFYVGDGELKALVEKYRDRLPPSEAQLREDLALPRPSDRQVEQTLEQVRAQKITVEDARRALGFGPEQRLSQQQSGQVAGKLAAMRAEARRAEQP